MAADEPQLMRVLCVDTSTMVESVALWDGEALAAERMVRRKRGHGPGLIDDIEGVLTDAGVTLDEVDALVCGLGPGSFTGLRIALATLKGLAMARDLPLHGVYTTAALWAAMPGRRVVAVLDARRGEVYAHGAGIVEPVCVVPERVAELLPEPAVMLGPGAQLYRERLGGEVPDDPTLHVPRAAFLRAAVDLSAPPALATLEPVYVRRADAEIHWPDGFPDAMGRLPT